MLERGRIMGFNALTHHPLTWERGREMP